MQERTANAIFFNRPLYLTYPPDGTNRMFVVEQGGTIKAFPNKNTVTNAEVKTFISLSVYRGHNEEGLLGFAFHPKYKQNGYFYVYYSANNPRRSVVSRFQVSSNDPNKADANSEKVLLEIGQPYGNHNGGMMAFGPDGYLYISVGDGGSGGDPLNHAQNLNTLLGTILRIDIDKQDPGKQYAVPADNPFVGRANAKPEIWAYGLRNVWRFSFDRATGTLWAGDVGQTQLEEIDIIVKGGNYGWRMMEGTQCYNPRNNCKKPEFILPVVEHDRSEARSITGGYVYRGKKLPSLIGAYVYADYVTGIIWALRHDGTKLLEHKRIATTNRKIASFGEDEAGELYFLAFNQRIYRLEPSSTQPSNFPKTLKATGCFSSLKPLVPAKGLIPYGVKVPLWSDGLDKQRWLALQNTDKITYKQEDAWDMPDNTVIVKHFSYNQTRGDASTKLHVETRFMVKQNGDWRGYTYQWNKDQTDATLVANRTPVTITQTDPANPGQPLTFTHTIPNRTDCLSCHTEDAGRILGVQTRQMNSLFNYKDATDNQLRALDHIQIFTQSIDYANNTFPSLPALNDTNVPAADRARAYLHTNCSYCHRPGIANSSTDLRIYTSFKDSKTCNVVPSDGVLGVAGAKIITPGKPDQSTLYLRVSKRGVREQMPTVGSNRVHDFAVSVIKQWIQELKACP